MSKIKLPVLHTDSISEKGHIILSFIRAPNLSHLSSISTVCQFSLQGALRISIPQVQAFIISYLAWINFFPYPGIHQLAGFNSFYTAPGGFF